MKTKPKLYHNLSAWLFLVWIFWFASESAAGKDDGLIFTLGIVSVILVVQVFGEHITDLLAYYNEKD